MVQSQQNKKLLPMLVGRLACLLVCAVGIYTEAYPYSANKVWFEFREGHGYRVYVNYTVPALKEFRESYVDFKQKKEAEKFYWSLIRGADFYPPSSAETKFQSEPAKPEPW